MYIQIGLPFFLEFLFLISLAVVGLLWRLRIVLTLLREELTNCGGEKAAPPSDLLLPLPLGSCPWLVSADGNRGKLQTFYGNITGSTAVKTYSRSIPTLEGKKVLSCSFGWLVLYDHKKKLLSFCNSTTFGDTVVLRRLWLVSIYGVSSCVLIPNKNATSFDQIDNFKILIFLKEYPAILCGWIGAHTYEWTATRYWESVKRHFTWKADSSFMIFRRAVVCGGKIFAQLGEIRILHFFHSLWCIEIVEHEQIFSVKIIPDSLAFSKIKVPGRDASRHDAMMVRYKKVYVVESSGELFFLYFWGATQVFNMYKLNVDTMELEGIRYLEGTAFFVGKEYCVSCPVSGSGRIYFTTKRRDGNLYCFHMKDQSVSAYPVSCTPWLRHPIWIMPRLVLRPKDDDLTNINNQRRNCTTSISSMLEMDDNRDEHRQLCNLPFDVLEHLISKHLIRKDYMNFRAAGRICRSVAPPVNWRRVLSTSSEAASYAFHCPLLMFADQDESIYKFVDPSINSINDNHYFMKIPNPLLDEKIIRYSGHGWILLSERHSYIFLYNPFTRDMMIYNSRVPSLLESLFFFPKPSGIGIDDAHSFCYVTGFGVLKDNKVVVNTIDDPQAIEWNRYFHENDWNFELVTQISPVFFEDAFYYLDRQGKLGKLQIDFETGDLSWAVLDKPRKPSFNNCTDLSFYHNFLVECGGELISVFLGSLGKWIAVYKLNVDKDWARVTNLGSYDLYLSSTSCLSIQSNKGGNRIYFPALRRDYEIVYFSLNTNKWHFCGSQDSASDIRGTRWLVNSCWIKPTW